MIDNLFPFDIGAFVTKLNVEGSALVYSPFLGGSAFRFDIIVRYRILSTQNEGKLARLPVRHPLGALDGGLKGDSPGDFWVLGSYASRASSYHLRKNASVFTQSQPRSRNFSDISSWKWGL